MVFSSVEFLFFFLPIVLAIYWCLLKISKGNIRCLNIFLTIVSLLFYASGEPVYIFIMLISLITNYVVGRVLDKHKRKLYLILGITINLSILIIFKYLDFLIESINGLVHTSFRTFELALPIGISFYTFQIITYIVDVYKGEVKAQKKVVDLALYISFFPQLIAGPIVEYKEICSQIAYRKHSIKLVESGIYRFVVGLAKKIVMSNNLGYIADQIMGGELENCGTVNAWLGILCYTLQIYFDFSGYSDMAIGLGKMFGFNLPENFNYPYVATGIRDFWRRWHMTLSGFFKKYVYIPLGGNRRAVYRNLWIVFFLTGLWHGASWNFVIWGLWHGLFSVFERILGDRFEKIPVLVRRIYTIVVVMLGWVFFKMKNLSKAIEFLGILFGVKRNNPLYDLGYYLDGFNSFIIILGCISCIPIFKIIFSRYENSNICRITVLIMLVISGMFLQASSYNPFIYFQF